MGEEMEKTAKEVLGSDKSVAGKALKVISVQMDRQFKEIKEEIKSNHTDVIEAIKSLELSITEKQRQTDAKFEQIDFIFVFSKYPKLLAFVLIGIISVSLVFGIKEIL